MKRLLIIEDDPNTLSGLVELLFEEGYSVDGVENGYDALEIAKKKQFDIVLCDYALPDINGLDVCSELKQINPELILFMITGKYNKKIAIMAHRCGIIKIFLKPLILEDLFKTLLLFSTKINFNINIGNHIRPIYKRRIHLKNIS